MHWAGEQEFKRRFVHARVVFGGEGREYKIYKEIFPDNFGHRRSVTPLDSSTLT